MSTSRLVKLEEVCEFEKDQGFYSHLPYVGLEDIESNTGKHIGIDTSREVKSHTFKFSPRHVLYGRLRPYLNKLILPNFEGHCSTEIFPLLPSQKLLREYLFYWLLSTGVATAINETCTGARMPRANMNAVLKFEIPLPPIPEQQRIVAILDDAFERIDTAIANTEKSLANARELFESYLNKVFSERGDGWVEKKLGEIMTIGSSKRVYESDWTPSGVPFYGGKEIVKLANTGHAISDVFIPVNIYNEIKSKYGVPQPNDILMTARGTIGVGYVVKSDDFFYYKDGNVICLSPKISTNPQFILYAFKSEMIRKQLSELSGTTVTHLSITKANELIIFIPDFSSQNLIVGQIDRVQAETQRLETIYTQKLTALKELKQSLLQKAFTGQLTSGGE